MNPEEQSDLNPAPAKLARRDPDPGFVDTDVEEDYPDTMPEKVYDYITITIKMVTYEISPEKKKTYAITDLYAPVDKKTNRPVSFHSSLSFNYVIANLLPVEYCVTDFKYTYDMRVISKLANPLSSCIKNAMHACINATQLEYVVITVTYMGDEASCKECKQSQIAPLGAIFKKLGINTTNYSIVYNETRLDLHKTLADYNITGNIRVQLIPNMVTSSPHGAMLQCNTSVSKIHGGCVCKHYPNTKCIRTVPGFANIPFVSISEEEITALPTETRVNYEFLKTTLYKHGFRSLLVYENIGIYMLTEEQARLFPNPSLILYCRKNKSMDPGIVMEARILLTKMITVLCQRYKLNNNPVKNVNQPTIDTDKGGPIDQPAKSNTLKSVLDKLRKSKADRLNTLARSNYKNTVGMGLQSNASGTGVPRNSRSPGVGLEFNVNGTSSNN